MMRFDSHWTKGEALGYNLSGGVCGTGDMVQNKTKTKSVGTSDMKLAPTRLNVVKSLFLAGQTGAPAKPAFGFVGKGAATK